VTTAGAPEFATHVPTQDATAAAQLRAAGAIVLGKTNTPRFGSDAQTRRSPARRGHAALSAWPVSGSRCSSITPRSPAWPPCRTPRHRGAQPG
jgi:Asp-tRNA(Asn)/Glu-tRNA(Gln) amidotransferase A subunit family amidase